MKRTLMILIVVFALSASAFAVSVKLLGVRERDIISYTKTIDAGAVSELVLEVQDADVEFVLAKDSSEIVVEYDAIDGMDDPPQYTQDLGQLTITEPKTMALHVIHLNTQKSRMVITLAPQTFRTISITSASGNVTLPPLQTQHITVSTRTGAVMADNVIGTLEVQTMSGSVDGVFDVLSAPVTIASKTGAVTLTLPKTNDFVVDAKSEHGRVAMDSLLQQAFVEGRSVQVRTTWGAITILLGA